MIDDTARTSDVAPPSSPAVTAPRSRQHIQLSLTIGFLILGVLLALQVNTQRAMRSGGISRRPEWWYQEQLRDREERMQNLESHSRELQGKIVLYEENIGKGSRELQMLKTDLESLRALAGVAAVSGPGIVVEVADNPRAAKQGEDYNLFIVHDYDLLRLANELWNAGAEAIAINGIRLCPGWDIRCSGSTVKVRDQRVASPYRIEAIGNAPVLQSAVNLPGGIADELRGLGLKVSLRALKRFTLPGAAPEKLKLAQPVSEP